MQFRPVLFLAVCLLSGLLNAASQTLDYVISERDLLLGDFEGGSFGDWKEHGDAFGGRPDQGNAAIDYIGKGFANSLVQGVRRKGKLMSPVFRIQRKNICFLLGGGGSTTHQTSVNLVVNNKVVRTAHPYNDIQLDRILWDVSKLRDQMAQIEIIDQDTTEWYGYVLADQFFQTDESRFTDKVKRTFEVDSRYLNLPVKNGARKHTLGISVDGKQVREFKIELAESDPDFWVFLDIGEWKGRKLAIETYQAGQVGESLALMYQSNMPQNFEDVYNETFRPLVHFSSKRGWVGDPNGLVHYDGVWHMFYQHNQFGTKWGNMTWGHATSTDLVYWEEQGSKIYPDDQGVIFSGSAVVDWNNSAGLQKGTEKTLVAFYTARGEHTRWSVGAKIVQCMAYSNDKGETWNKYEGNPVVPTIIIDNRDPKVVWHTPTRKWIMVLYLEGQDYAILSSHNLKDWKQLQRLTIEGASECPDLFEISLDGDTANKKWVFTGANGRYLVGAFDGELFHIEQGSQKGDWGNASYAVQTFSDVPESDGRRIQIAHINEPYYFPMPFSQRMSFPRELTLRSTPDGMRLFSRPVREIANLYSGKHEWTNIILDGTNNPTKSISTQAFHMIAEFEPGDAEEVVVDIRGFEISYNVKQQALVAGPTTDRKKADLKLVNGKLRLEILSDKGSIEVFANDGIVPMGFSFPDTGNSGTIDMISKGGQTRLNSLVVHDLKSAWPSHVNK